MRYDLLSLLSIATPMPMVEPSCAVCNVGEWEELWTQVLARCVDEAGRIDFDLLSRDHEDLDRVVAFVAATDPGSNPNQFPDSCSRLAFYINAHNALAMYGVLHIGAAQCFGGRLGANFFRSRTFVLAGRAISLDRLANKVIRPFDDERVHFALCSMVVSSPELQRFAFSGPVLDEQLYDVVRRFVRDRRNVWLDRVQNELWISAIFGSYEQAFLARAPSLVSYINCYRDAKIPFDLTVRFLPYHRTVNHCKWSLVR